MRYEFLKTNDEGVKIYSRIDDDGVCRLTCSENYSEYQAWLAEQSTPSVIDEA
jgi:hypothetical protein